MRGYCDGKAGRRYGGTGGAFAFSQRGARIHLKNNGQVEINGQVFPPLQAEEEGRRLIVHCMRDEKRA